MANPTPKLVAGSTLSKEDLISVVIPCFNHADFLPEAIGSVLTQNYPNFEVIVVDDGSTDNTPEIVRRYPSVRYVYQENAGLSVARNTGLQHSRGGFLVLLDADDRLLPHALETGVSCIREHPECAFVSGHCRVIDSNGTILPSPRQLRVENEHYLKLLRGGSYIWCPATVLYQRYIFDFVHGFNVALSPAADYEFYLRVTRDFPVYSYDEVVAEYRQHSSNMSRDVLAMQRAALAAHEAQWHFVKANSHYREAYDAGTRFWQNDYPFQQMVSRIREIVRKQLPPDAIVTVATGGHCELRKLILHQYDDTIRFTSSDRNGRRLPLAGCGDARVVRGTASAHRRGSIFCGLAFRRRDSRDVNAEGNRKRGIYRLPAGSHRPERARGSGPLYQV